MSSVPVPPLGLVETGTKAGMTPKQMFLLAVLITVVPLAMSAIGAWGGAQAADPNWAFDDKLAAHDDKLAAHADRDGHPVLDTRVHGLEGAVDDLKGDISGVVDTTRTNKTNILLLCHAAGVTCER